MNMLKIQNQSEQQIHFKKIPVVEKKKIIQCQTLYLQVIYEIYISEYYLEE